MDATNSGSPKPKLSRYRSIRMKQQQQQQKQQSQEQVGTKSASSMTASISRSFSRYRHARQSPSYSSAQSPPAPSPTSTGVHTRPSAELSSSDSKTNRQEAMHYLMNQSRSRSRSRPRFASQGPARRERKAGEQPVMASSNERMGGMRRDSGDASDCIEAGGGSILPGFDAPVSTVRTGERKVRVRYQGSSVSLSVNGSTRASDLLRAASNRLAGDIDPNAFILMESFTAFSLERPIRKYEYVREVVNSWVYDGSNFLFIVPPSCEEALRQLEPLGGSTGAPADATFYLYHCHHRGRKWGKQFVTVHSDGQIIMSVKAGHHSKEYQHTICHLSDFDIYSIAAFNLPKKERPPKRYAFAIKSQQKASMFLSTENFVHYFCSSDEAIALGFYKAVHRWRSWYLTNKLDTDEVASREELAASNPDGYNGILMSNSEIVHDGGGVARHLSHSHSPAPSSQIRHARPERTPSRGDTTRDRSNDSEEPGPFSPSGLLGRTYSQRQQVMRGRERARGEQLNSTPRSSPHDLILSATRARSGSRQPGGNSPQSNRSDAAIATPSELGASALRRSTSVRLTQRLPKPLVDLTPVFQEPPQHSRKGKGRGVKVEPGVALVDVATGPELPPNAIAVPPATTWRRPQAAPPIMSSEHNSSSLDGAPGMPTNTQDSTLLRRQSLNHHHHHHQSHPSLRARHGSTVNNRHHQCMNNGAAPTPFMPDSLLSRGDIPFRGNVIPKGCGVATGDRNATKPLLDLSDMNPFVEGSLLRDMKTK